MTIFRVLGWAWIALSIAVLLVSGSNRLAETLGSPAPTDDLGARYVEHPVVALPHFVPGLVFVVLAPMRFIP